ncbi:transcriptional regulator with PAS, ATPase and Fis domain [Desulfitispora alkaliphila]|uniref:sigma-54 interaction domain-containing protein n=1 Tax=Desulfitispora alkaliphila TaxID=622674 RepID=UPI003D1DB5BB
MTKVLWSENWKLFYLALENIGTGVLLVDKTGKVKYANKLYCEFLKMDRDEVLGKQIWTAVSFTLMDHILNNAEKIVKIVKQQDMDLAVLEEKPIYESDEVVGGISTIISSESRGYAVILEKLRLLEEELSYYQERLADKELTKSHFKPFISANKDVQETVEVARRAALFDANILITGETGTGKEVLASAVHAESGRKKMPFIKVNCAAIPSNLLESELFGYEGGAFTGARATGKLGKFELADNGTIFLDEVGDMPLEMQAKILRVTQDREIERVGGTTTKKVDVRIIAATNRDLKELVAQGKFREDLYYRLLVIGLYLPPLRKRIDDLDFLCRSILSRLSMKYQISRVDITKRALDAFKKYDWPGNIRELENLLERAINLATAGSIDVIHLPEGLLKQSGIRPLESVKPLKEAVEEAEVESIVKALAYAGGSKVEAAKILGLSRTALYKKMEKYNIG